MRYTWYAYAILSVGSICCRYSKPGRSGKLYSRLTLMIHRCVSVIDRRTSSIDAPFGEALGNSNKSPFLPK